MAQSIISKVPAPMNNKDILKKRTELEPNTVYEDPDIKNLFRVHKAENIIQQILLIGSVLFEIMREVFDDIIKVYQAINQ